MRRAIALIGVALGLAGASSHGSPDGDLTSRRPALTPVSLAFPTPDDGWVLDHRGRSGAEISATRDAGASWVTSVDGGRSWTVRGAVHPSMSAALDVQADLAAGSAGRLWLTAHDPESCAMHSCGVDGAWSSADGGRRWR